jgi:catechol 2,3-dioxygenase-like lactoylglutathione lyase family enzyme
MKLEGLVWLGVRTERFEETVRLYRDVMGLHPYREDGESVRFRLENGTEIHVYGPRDEFHRFFGTAPVIGFLVDDVTGARREMEAAGIRFVGPIQHSESESWSHFVGADENVYELISRRRS